MIDVASPIVAAFTARGDEPLELEFYVIDVEHELDELETDAVGTEALEDVGAGEPELAIPEEVPIDVPPGDVQELPQEASGGNADAEPDIERCHSGTNEPVRLVHPEDFWAEVVRLQQTLASQPEHRGRVLETALAWAASRMSQQVSSSGPSPKAGFGSPAAIAGAFQEDGVRSPSLEEQATAALVLAWQHKDSALHASGSARA